MAAGITENDVWKAADALLLEGLRPTIERVRQKIGRGSPNTVSPYLETWFKSLGARIKDPGAFSAPAALPDPIHQAAKHFWETALSAARAELEEHASMQRAELEEARRAVAEQSGALASREAALQGQLRAQAQALELAQRETKELRARLEERDEVLRKREVEIDKVEREATAARAHAADLQARLDDERGQWAAERKDLEARSQANEQRWALEVDRARETAKRLEKELSELNVLTQGRLAAREKEKEALSKQLSEVMSRLTDASTELRVARAAQTHAETARANTERLTEASVAELRERAKTLESQLGAALEQLRVKDAEHLAAITKLVHSRPQTASVAAKRARSL